MTLILSIFYMLMVIGGIREISCTEVDCGKVVDEGSIGDTVYTVRISVPTAADAIRVLKRDKNEALIEFEITTNIKRDGRAFGTALNPPVEDTCPYNVKARMITSPKYRFPPTSIKLKANHDCDSLLDDFDASIERHIRNCLGEHLTSTPPSIMTSAVAVMKPLTCGQILDSLIGKKSSRFNNVVGKSRLDAVIQVNIEKLLIPNQGLLLVPDLTLDLNDGGRVLHASLGTIIFNGNVRRIQNVHERASGSCGIGFKLLVPSATITWEEYRITGDRNDYGFMFSLLLSNIEVFSMVNLDLLEFPCEPELRRMIITHGSISLPKSNKLDEKIKSLIIKQLPSIEKEFFRSLSRTIATSIRYQMERTKCDSRRQRELFGLPQA